MARREGFPFPHVDIQGVLDRDIAPVLGSASMGMAPRNEELVMSDTTQAPEAPATEPVKTTKSIVPSKYSGRYKNGGDDPLALFIKEQCKGQDGAFSFDAFFHLCAQNGVPTEKVEHYKAQVAEKRHGAEGRARMTLRNMLATIVRKNGKALAADGSEVPIDLPKPALTGAAKEAKATSTDNAANPAAAGTPPL